MQELQNLDTLVVKQQKEWAEVITGFETKNRYAVMDTSGQELYWAAEESSFVFRNFLSSYRPFTIHVDSKTGGQGVKFKKKFAFYYHTMEVLDSNEALLGTIKRKFTWFSKEYAVFDSSGRQVYTVHGPFFRPWTFKIPDERGTEVGRIAKKWSGLGTEFFTDADNFHVTFPSGASPELRGILFGALFMIDMMHFEQ